MNPYWDNGVCQLYHADAREIPLADQTVHCVVTSPPYFGLRVYREVGAAGIGLETSVEEYIANLVAVFREVRRVLRDDGVLWLNLGESRNRDPLKGQHKPGDSGKEAYIYDNGDGRASSTLDELPEGNRLGIPERVVLALQADGWIWRDTIIWAKPSAMPESVNGTRWERHRVRRKDLPKMLGIKTTGGFQSESTERGRPSELLSTVHGKGSPSVQGFSEGPNQSSRDATETTSDPTVQEMETGISQPPGSLDSDASVEARGQQATSADDQMASEPCEGEDQSARSPRWNRDRERLGAYQGEPSLPLFLLQEEAHETGDGSHPVVENGREARGSEYRAGMSPLQRSEGNADGDAFIDCPGCPQCADNDGLVLRKGSWRTTAAYEYIFMLVKQMNYFSDAEAVKTAAKTQVVKAPDGWDTGSGAHGSIHRNGREKGQPNAAIITGANRRSVWNDISPEPYGGPHYATFPSDLPRICIQASTSEMGCCPRCGSQWARVVERGEPQRIGGNAGVSVGHGEGPMDRLGSGQWDKGHMPLVMATQTLGWRPTCGCNAGSPVPALVLDPFAGTFTTGLAAQRLGRRAVGIDLSEDYLQQAIKRMESVALPMELGI